MKKIIFYMFLITFFGSSKTLEKFIHTILSFNPKIKEEKNYYLLSLSELKIAKAKHNPTLNASIETGKEYTKTFANLNQEKILNEYQAKLIGSYNLFSGFKISNEIKEKEELVKINKNKFYQKAIDISFIITRLYLNILKTQKLLDIASENLMIHQDTYSKVIKRLEIGVSYESEKYQTSARIELAKSNEIIALKNYEIAKINFKKLLHKFGEEEKDKMEKEEKDKKSNNNKEEDNDNEEFQEIDIKLVDLDEDALIETYKQNNFNIKLEKSKVDVNYYQYKQKMSKFYPTLDLKFSRSLSENIHGLEAQDDTFKLYLSLNYNIYNGGIDEASRASQIYKLNIQKNKLQDFSLSAEEEIRLNFLQYRLLRSQVESINNQLSLLEKTKSLYEKEYTNNKKTIIDLLNIKQEFNFSRSQQVNIKYNILEVYFKIKALTGEYRKIFNLNKIFKL